MDACFFLFIYLWLPCRRPGLGREWQPTPSILAWRIPWAEEAGGLQFMELQRGGHDSGINTLWLCWVFIALCRFSLVATSGNDSPVAVPGLLIAVASLVVEHRL